jgi:O-succinylbenzoic acid--CoA ligase
MTGLSLLEAARDPASARLPAVIASGVVHSYGDLAPRVASLAGRLHRSGIGAGSRVALVAENRPETAVALYALIELGAVLVPIHPRLTALEAQAILTDAAPDLILHDEQLGGEPSAPPCPSRSDSFGSSNPLAIVYTSGTTGVPKGAILSRGAFVASAGAGAQNLGWMPADRWIACMPLCHIGGLSILTRCLLARRPVILEPRFDPASVLRAIDREGATLLSVVPTMLRALLDEPDPRALARLRAILVGGAAAPAALLEECARRGILALTTYGLTEGCSQVTTQRPRPPHLTEPGSGHPLPGISLSIRTAEGAEAVPGEVGRIHLRGPNLMSGYWRGPTTAPMTPFLEGGWFDSGDLGAVDAEGRLHVHARRTDLIVTGGENVDPVEVERALEACPGVRRALVFGIPDERWGQIVAAAIELEPQADAGRDFKEAVAHTLAPHKRPRRVWVVDALPVNRSGKLDRAAAAQIRHAIVATLW